MKTLKLIGAIVLCLLVGNIGTLFTISNIPTWYAHLVKPPLTPPNTVFGPVWTALFVLMGICLFLLWQARPSRERRVALTAFAVQLVLNVLWSAIFFGAHWLGVAVVEVLVFWFAIAVTMVHSWRVNRVAEAVLVPYLLWVSFASYLTIALWILNR